MAKDDTPSPRDASPSRTSSPPPATPGTQPGELSFLYNVTTAPCFRTSALTGLGGGAAIAALNLQRHSTYTIYSRETPERARARALPLTRLSAPRARCPREEDPMHAAETMVKTGCAVALLSWVVCRKKYYDQRELTYDSIETARRRSSAAAAAKAKHMREPE